MKFKWSTIFAAVLLASVLLIPAQASAILSYVDNTVNYTMVLNGAGNQDTFSINATVYGVTFSQAGPAICATSNCTAILNLTAISTTAGGNFVGFDAQGGFSGTFTFSDLTDSITSANYYPGVFLQGTFSTGTFSGTAGGGSPTFSVSDQVNCAVTNSCSAVNISSAAYWTLFVPADDNQQSFSISLTNYTSGADGLSLNGGGFINSGSASGGGTFASNAFGTPEPSTMMLLGGGLIGLGVIGRKRRKRT